MLKKHYWKFVVAVMITALIAGVGLVPNAIATTYHTVSPTDCLVADYAADENMGEGGMGTSGRLYITWDLNYLYVSVSPVAFGVTVYLDTAPNGASDSAFFGTHQIAASGGGYEHAFYGTRTGNFNYASGTTGSWVAAGDLQPGTLSCASNVAPRYVEFGIPWSNIGSPSQLTVLVTDRVLADETSEYWPDVSSNTGGSTPSFSEGYVFDNLGTGIAPNGGATAITLSNISARNSSSDSVLLAGILVFSSLALLLLWLRNRRQTN